MTVAEVPDGAVLLVSIGPIQDFIVAARTCQDLWFGSWMLSDLARSTAKAIQGAGAELIFPSWIDDESVGVANKILALIPDMAGAADIASAGKRALDERIDAIARAAWGRLSAPWDRKLAEMQMADLIEFYWSAASVSISGSYESARKHAEQQLAARKVTRDWSAVAAIPSEPRLKSSVDGIREAVVSDADREKVAAGKLWNTYHVKDQEQLCGPGYVKRLGRSLTGDDLGRKWIPSFHSSSHIAASAILLRAARMKEAGKLCISTYLDALSSPDNGGKLDLREYRVRAGDHRVAKTHSPWLGSEETEVTYQRAFGLMGDDSVGFDGALWFEGRLQEAFEDAFEGKPAVLEKAARRAKDSLESALVALGIDGAVPPYYALLLADGDRMGRTISALGEGSGDGAARHRKFGAALDNFARSARSIVETAGGSLVFAGGDDVFALLPLHTVLEAATNLKNAFDVTIEDACDVLPSAMRPTLSMGISIVHHIEPLVDARHAVQEAEKRAKRAGRDTLAISLSMRNGADVQVSAKWNADLSSRLNRWATLLDMEEAPDSVLFEIERTVIPFLMTRSAILTADDIEVARLLVTRCASRRRKNEGSSEESLPFADELVREFFVDADVRKSVERVTSELRIARVLRHAYRAAWGGAPIRTEVAS